MKKNFTLFILLFFSSFLVSQTTKEWGAKMLHHFVKGDVDSFCKCLDKKVLLMKKSEWLKPMYCIFLLDW